MDDKQILEKYPLVFETIPDIHSILIALWQCTLAAGLCGANSSRAVPIQEEPEPHLRQCTALSLFVQYPYLPLRVHR